MLFDFFLLVPKAKGLPTLQYSLLSSRTSYDSDAHLVPISEEQSLKALCDSMILIIVVYLYYHNIPYHLRLHNFDDSHVFASKFQMFRPTVEPPRI